MPTFTRITKVGAFSDDVAAQINANFSQLGTVLSQSGIDPQKALEKAHQQQAEAHAQHPDEPVPDPSKPWYTDPPPPPEPQHVQPQPEAQKSSKGGK